MDLLDLPAISLAQVCMGQHLIQFLKDSFPADKDLAGYVICIANRDKSFIVAQGYDSAEVRDKVSAKLIDEMKAWAPPQR